MSVGNPSRPHFVWTRTQGAPVMVADVLVHRRAKPEKWGEVNYGVNNWRKASVIDMHELTAAQNKLSVDQLAELFPLPAWVHANA